MFHRTTRLFAGATAPSPITLAALGTNPRRITRAGGYVYWTDAGQRTNDGTIYAVPEPP